MDDDVREQDKLKINQEEFLRAIPLNPREEYGVLNVRDGNVDRQTFQEVVDRIHDCSKNGYSTYDAGAAYGFWKERAPDDWIDIWPFVWKRPPQYTPTTEELLEHAERFLREKGISWVWI
jgi:hypothetical protein